MLVLVIWSSTVLAAAVRYPWLWMLASLRRRRERNLVYDATSTEAVVVRPLNGTIAAGTRVSETNKEPPTADMPVVRKKQSVKGYSVAPCFSGTGGCSCAVFILLLTPSLRLFAEYVHSLRLFQP